MTSAMPYTPIHSFPVLPSLMLAVFGVIAEPEMVRSGEDPSALCLQAAQTAADRTGVPFSVL